MPYANPEVKRILDRLRLRAKRQDEAFLEKERVQKRQEYAANPQKKIDAVMAYKAKKRAERKGMN